MFLTFHAHDSAVLTSGSSLLGTITLKRFLKTYNTIQIKIIAM